MLNSMKADANKWAASRGHKLGTFSTTLTMKDQWGTRVQAHAHCKLCGAIARIDTMPDEIDGPHIYGEAVKVKCVGEKQERMELE